MTKNNKTKKTATVTIKPETDREKQIAKSNFNEGYEMGKLMGHAEESLDELKRTMDRELDPKNIRKQNIKSFLDGFCYTFTPIALVAFAAFCIKIKHNK